MTREQAFKSYIICENLEEVDKSLKFLKSLGFICEITAEDYPDYLLVAVKENGYIFSIPNTKDHIVNYCHKRTPVLFKELFNKTKLTPETQEKVINIFKSARAFNEDSGLNYNALKINKIELSVCFQLAELGILGNYNNIFFLKNNETTKIIKQKEEIKEELSGMAICDDYEIF